MAMLKPVPRAAEPPAASLVDGAYRTMRTKILDNEWAPGHRALEQELALELGMSRTPVREALIRLAKEGLVEVVPRHGMRVLPVSAADMDEIYQLLGSLEATAAELVAQRKPAARDIAPLEAASRAMDAALKADDLDAWAQADERFHRHLVELCGNRLLAATVYNFWDRAHRARMFTLRLRPLPVHSTREHTNLVRAIRKGDAAAAREIHRAHRERGRCELTAILQRFKLAQM
ncbi:MAG: GntR family transcriptional regulator [Betaproteobacteria bacterium]